MMTIRQNGEPHKLYTRNPNAPYMNDAGKAACRLPRVTPKRSSRPSPISIAVRTTTMIERAEGKTFAHEGHHLPEHSRRVEGMYFIEQAVASSKENGA